MAGTSSYYKTDEEYREKHKARMRERVDCDICKCEVIKYKMVRHKKTKRHISNELKHIDTNNMTPEILEKIKTLLK